MYILPESVLQSFSLTPLDLSHLKKTFSDMELLNVISSLAGTSTPACMIKKRVVQTVGRVLIKDYFECLLGDFHVKLKHNE